jgi:hypothetical protein
MRIVTTLGLLALLLGSAVAGDTPDDRAVLAAIDQGRAAFAAGKTQEAVAHLNKAITLIQERTAGGLAGFLPARDASAWELGEVDTQSGQWGSGGAQWQWSQAQRRYVKKGDDGPEVNVMISNSPQLVEAQRGMLEALKSPAMREIMKKSQEASGQKLEFIEDGGWIGMLTTQESDSTLLALHTKVLVEVRVNRADDALVREFWQAIDRAGLAAAAK